MCGIAGIASLGLTEDFALAAERMAAALAHRGPDSHGTENLGSCRLVNTRLAIVDLSERGRQPMCNEDGSLWITYNGECYNAHELRPGLIERGHEFKSTTDTEVILHLYEEMGDRCVEKLRGMFAFAIWDSPERKLLLARDRLGIKPLYFYLSEKQLVFASEIKALLASGLVARKIDPSGVRAFLELGHIPPPWTAIAGVKPLEPGQIAVWKDGRFHTAKYWKVPTATNGHPLEPTAQVAERLGNLLLESSRKQLMSDVPIALFLSGGVDSAVLGALMRRTGAGHISALTVGFEEKSFDESDLSVRTAKMLGISRSVIRLPAAQMANSLRHAFWAMDQPTVDGLNAYWISRAAAEAGFKVAISGQGGDELFGGYGSIAWFDRFSRIAGLLKPLPKLTGRSLFDHEALPFRWRKLSYLFGADDPFVAAQLAVRVLFLEGDVESLLSPALATNTPFEASLHVRKWAHETDGQDLSQRSAFMDFPAHLEARLLRDGDAMSMAHSLEVRPMLLDHSIVEFVMSLPVGMRMQKKKLLLDATSRFLPEGMLADLLTRPKRTFTFPFVQWLGTTLHGTIEETFQPERLRSGGILKAAAVAKLWQRYMKNPYAVGWSRLWSVFVLARWCEVMGVGV